MGMERLKFIELTTRATSWSTARFEAGLYRGFSSFSERLLVERLRRKSGVCSVLDEVEVRMCRGVVCGLRRGK